MVKHQNRTWLRAIGREHAQLVKAGHRFSLVTELLSRREGVSSVAVLLAVGTA